MKISNKTKDKLAIMGVLLFMFAVAIALSLLFIVFVENIKAEEPNNEINMNKFYAEERIKAEMYYLSAWETAETMTEEEYAETFLKENKMPKFNSYQEAVEYRNEKLADEYYNEEEEEEEDKQDEMNKADEIYDMLQDEEASK